jgi:predicted SAM-dependent methyltransferase
MLIRRILYTVLPRPVVSALRERVAASRAVRRDRELRARVASGGPRRVVIGASGVFEPGWIPTDAQQLNLLRAETWAEFFEPESIDALLAEHVWEHLSVEEGRRAAETCYRYLKPGGLLRVAVPDGLHPDPAYRDYIKPGGPGGGEVGGHKVAYTYRQLQEVFQSAGFETQLLEYHDEQGQPHARAWETDAGMIHRSQRFDARGLVSIVLDASKPLAASAGGSYKGARS